MNIKRLYVSLVGVLAFAAVGASVNPDFIFSLQIFIAMLLLVAPVVFALENISGRVAFLCVGLVLFSLEAFGVYSGIIYGEFQYLDLARPVVFGTPTLMVAMWPALVVGAREIVGPSKNPWVRGILVALLLVAFDLVMDPGAVHMGVWSWIKDGAWFGVPASNFIGWFALGLIGSRLMDFCSIKIDPKYYLWSTFCLVGNLVFWSTYVVFSGFYSLGVLGFLLLTLIACLMYLTQKPIN